MQVGQNVLPYYFRVKAAQQLKDVNGKEAVRSAGFIHGIAEHVDAKLNTSSIPDYSSTKRTTVLTQKGGVTSFL